MYWFSIINVVMFIDLLCWNLLSGNAQLGLWFACLKACVWLAVMWLSMPNEPCIFVFHSGYSTVPFKCCSSAHPFAFPCPHATPTPVALFFCHSIKSYNTTFHPSVLIIALPLVFLLVTLNYYLFISWSFLFTFHKTPKMCVFVH